MTDDRKRGRDEDRDKIEKKDIGRGTWGDKRSENEVSFDRPIPPEKPKEKD